MWMYMCMYMYMYCTLLSPYYIPIGVTFDTGGISIKPSAGMPSMKGDMGGAACVVATVMAIAQLDCPVSVVGLVPLCENMPSGNAVKPGDVVTAMNGKTISVSTQIVQLHM